MASSVDYTSRDFISIREDLISLIPQFLPEWTSRSDSDFGIVMLSMFAYVGDGLHYYADKIANEAYLNSATQRGSVLRIASLLDYTPIGNVAAQVVVRFSNDSLSAVTIPVGTSLETVTVSGTDVFDKPRVFETVANLAVPAKDFADVAAVEGETVTSEPLGSGLSTGEPDQRYTLFQTPVIDGSVTVAVDEGLGSVLWDQVESLLDSGPFDRSFLVRTQEDDTVQVVFGDGASGRVPSRDALLRATYRVGGGIRGNVPAYQINRIASIVPAGITVTNLLPAAGGSDAESTDSIRVNAPSSLQTLERATTTADFARLALTVPGVGKAKAIPVNEVTISVAISPVGGGGITAGTPTAVFAALKTKAQAALNAAKPANMTVNIVDPVYVPINVAVGVHARPRTNIARLQDSVTLALQRLFEYDNVILGDKVTPTDIHLTIVSVQGVEYIDLTLLSRTGAGTEVIALADYEIPVAGTITVTGIASP